MTHVLANETATGAIAMFTSPIPWGTTNPTPTINGRTRTIDFTIVDQRTILFAEPPRLGDVVGFFVETS